MAKSYPVEVDNAEVGYNHRLGNLVDFGIGQLLQMDDFGSREK